MEQGATTLLKDASDKNKYTVRPSVPPYPVAQANMTQAIHMPQTVLDVAVYSADMFSPNTGLVMSSVYRPYNNMMARDVAAHQHITLTI